MNNINETNFCLNHFSASYSLKGQECVVEYDYKMLVGKNLSPSAKLFLPP